jgi:hypothetical protein
MSPTETPQGWSMAWRICGTRCSAGGGLHGGGRRHRDRVRDRDLLSKRRAGCARAGGLTRKIPLDAVILRYLESL